MIKPNAQQAIVTLSCIKDKLGPAILAYWVTPNTVLTLSGARAFCDGVFYNKSQKTLKTWEQEMDSSLKVIASIVDIYFAEARIDKSTSQERYAGYELILRQGLHKVINETKLLSAQAKKAILKGDMKPKKFMEALEWWLYENQALKNFDKQDLNHIAFGILLGYPDKAITGLVEVDKGDYDTFAEPLIRADIRGGDYYICPQPVYDYPRSMVPEPSIRAHEKLWSSILHDYYFSDFHKNLEKNKSFLTKARELELMR